MLHRHLLVTVSLASALCAQGEEKQPDDTAFTLENIFPDKKQPLFGPSAGGMAFSHDGAFAAYLHRGYDERRHGPDLWLVDVASGEVTRVTSALVLAEFQAAAREVVDDRVERAQAKAKKSKSDDETPGGEKSGDEQRGNEQGKGKQEAEQAEVKARREALRQKHGNEVDADDAEREKAPRHSGVSSFEWAPEARELLFTSAGDIYRFVVGGHGIERLTCTKASERDVQYLPDGSGYTYLLDGALMQVRFQSHLIEQLDPRLPRGETMSSYRISPDGEHLVFLASKGAAWRDGSRKVKIAGYRDRFVTVREVPRTVSDDELPERETHVYLHALAGRMQERDKPVRIWTHKDTGPRDILRVPEWAPDSSRVTFATFEQKSSQVLLLQAAVTAPDVEREPDVEAKSASAGESTAKASGVDGDEERGDADAFVVREAEVVYRFLHDGGPNTPRMMQPRYGSDSRSIVFLSEQTGFRHVHVLDPLYQSQRPLTSGRYEVYPFDISDDHAQLFVTATKEHPTRQDIYVIELSSGEMTRLNDLPGVYSGVAVAADGRTALAMRQSFGLCSELVLIGEGDRHVALTDSHPERTAKLAEVEPEFFSYQNRHGHEIHGHVFKPEGWAKTDARPLLLYVYGGPLGTRKQVVDGNYHSASYFFGQYMAREHGWVTCTIDPRGMSGYGGLFEKANFEQVGKPQVEDLVDGVRHMVEHFGVDEAKVAMHGWSFGGFQTQMCMYSEPDVFRVGIAGAGPTEWENYNAWYSTGTIGDSRPGKTDLAKYSLLPLAKNLKGKLLLVHGMEDSNVLYQDTVRMYRELLKADKETLVELFVDPTGGHGLGGDVTTLRRYRKYEEFLVRNLGSVE